MHPCTSKQKSKDLRITQGFAPKQGFHLLEAKQSRRPSQQKRKATNSQKINKKLEKIVSNTTKVSQNKITQYSLIDDMQQHTKEMIFYNMDGQPGQDNTILEHILATPTIGWQIQLPSRCILGLRERTREFKTYIFSKDSAAAKEDSKCQTIKNPKHPISLEEET